jgi:hypothetical protein
MRFVRVLSAAALVSASVQPAFAQSVTRQPVTPPAITPPNAWTVAPDTARGLVQIGKTATDGRTVFTGGCNSLYDAGFSGTISRYNGTGLQRIGGQVERVLFEIDGEEWKEAFSAQLRYVASSGSWEIAKVLAPVFVNSFSRGATLTVRNANREKVITFDLTGSSAAARTMRSVCGFP